MADLIPDAGSIQAPAGLTPDEGSVQAPGEVGGMEALGRGALQGISLGFGDEIQGALQSIFTDKTYQQARDSARQANARAQAAHSTLYGGGEVAGGLASMFVPGLGIAEGAGLGTVAAKSALAGGLGGLGSSEATDVGGIAKDIGVGAALGGAGGAVAHGVGVGIGRALGGAEEAGSRQAVKGIVAGEGKAPPASMALTRKLIDNENVPGLLREDVNGTTLAREAYKPAEAIKPLVEAKQAEIGKGLDKIYDRADEASGGVKVSDLVKHYDEEIGKLRGTPGNQGQIRALESAKQDVIKSWGTRPVFDPNVPVKGGSFEGAKSGDSAAKLEKMAANVNSTAPDAHVAEKSPMPTAILEGDRGLFHSGPSDLTGPLREGISLAPSTGESIQYIRNHGPSDGYITKFAIDRDANIAGIEEAKEVAEQLGMRTEDMYDHDFIDHPKIRAKLKEDGWDGIEFTDQGPAHTGNQTHQTTRIFNTDVIKPVAKARVVDGKIVPLDLTGTQTVASPAARAALLAEAQRIRDAATKDAFDPSVKVPSKDVRAFATTLMKRGQTDEANPALATQIRQRLGSVTRDFVNGHVGNVLGADDRAALEGLNARMSASYAVQNALDDRAIKESAGRISQKGGLETLLGHGATAASVGMLAHGNIPAAAATFLAPKVIAQLPRAGRFATTQAARANEILLSIRHAASMGNPWAQSQIRMLAQTPLGAARLAQLGPTIAAPVDQQSQQEAQ